MKEYFKKGFGAMLGILTAAFIVGNITDLINPIIDNKSETDEKKPEAQEKDFETE